MSVVKQRKKSVREAGKLFYYVRKFARHLFWFVLSWVGLVLLFYSIALLSKLKSYLFVLLFLAIAI